MVTSLIDSSLVTGGAKAGMYQPAYQAEAAVFSMHLAVVRESADGKIYRAGRLYL